jgi:hypothetical protein
MNGRFGVITEAIALLKSEIAELEAHLQNSGPPAKSRNMKSVARRMLASAQRVEELISQMRPSIQESLREGRMDR